MPSIRPQGRRAAGCIAAALLALALGLPVAARAVPYVVHYHSFGEWSVVCWYGLVSDEQSCYIDGPAIAFNALPRSSAVRITEHPPGTLTVTVFSRSGTSAGARVSLSVDGRRMAEGDPDQLDRVTWSGEEAKALVEQLRAGKKLHLDLSDVRKRPIGEQDIPLAGFADAFDDYRTELARFTGARAPGP
jgi:invasion protein IalB